jgi:CHAD domain-containing protein
MQLELGLDPDDAKRLARLPMLKPLRHGKARSQVVRCIWHDSPDRELARQGLALAEQRPGWRLERLVPDTETWAPGAPVPVLATGRSVADLGLTLPEPLVPTAALEGRTLSLGLVTEQGPVTLALLNGTVRAVATERRVSRLWLEGSVEAVQPLALGLASELDAGVPCASVAALAAAVATGAKPPPRHEGPPDLPPGQTVAESFAHVVGHLTDVILHFAPAAAEGNEGPEPVHQMRVAVRRLRSALKVFHHAISHPHLVTVDRRLKALAGKLAPTRDWDVFVTETITPVTEAFAGEARMARLLAAVERRRRTCHDELREFLGSVEFRCLGIELACLAGTPMPVVDEAPLATFAAGVLDKRLNRVLQTEDDIAALEPSALHALRLRAKRLRYAAEIFAPLFPSKLTHRFIRRLSGLQDRLGTMNDGAVAASLLGELANGNHAFATGLVLGFIAARNRDTRARIDKGWRKFHHAAHFWE